MTNRALVLDAIRYLAERARHPRRGVTTSRAVTLRPRVTASVRVLPPPPTKPRQQWTMDFTQDSLATGRQFRTLNLVDTFTRECLAIEVDRSLPRGRVVRVLQRLAELHGVPEVIRIDNDSEFTSHVVDAWAYEHKVKLDFIRPGKPPENAHIESFNGKFRDECLETTGSSASMTPRPRSRRTGSTTTGSGRTAPSTTEFASHHLGLANEPHGSRGQVTPRFSLVSRTRLTVDRPGSAPRP